MTQPTKHLQNNINNNLKLIIPTPISPILIQKNTQQDNNTQSVLQSTYHHYLKLIKENTILNNQINIIERQKTQLKDKLQSIRKQHDEKRKRHRRTADEISKNYTCPLKDCNRSYGSQGSLLQHIKLKHETFYNSEQYQSILLSKNKKNKEKLISYSLQNSSNKNQANK